MIRDKKHFYLGLTMTIIFVIILCLMFSNIFNGTNAFHASDELFNSIAKGSTNYFQTLEDQNKTYAAKDFSADLVLPEAEQERASTLLQAAGIEVQQTENSLHIQGSLGRLIDRVLRDSRIMFDNNDVPLVEEYHMTGKKALLVWWDILRAMDKSLKAQHEYPAAKFITEVTKRGVEVGYNFYGVEAQSAADRIGVLTFSLVFYVAYTLWWGFAIFFLFEGIGLVMSSKGKKEV